MPTPLVRLYARPDCHLCEQARRELLRLRREGARFELEEINIEADPALHAKFLERIPVVELDREVVSELRFDAAGLRARLDTVSR